MIREIPIPDVIECNKCGSTITGSFATLTFSDIDDEYISTYCEECYSEIVATDKIESDNRSLIKI